MSHITDEITENQRRLAHLPGVILSASVANTLNVGLDQQYSKQHLRPHDPGAWVGPGNVSISSPGAFPLAEGYATLYNWVYIVDTPTTDSGGWIYRDDFTHDKSHNHNTITTMVRSRRWKRVSCPIAEQRALQEEEERREEAAHQERLRLAGDSSEAGGAGGEERQGYYPGKYLGKLVNKLNPK